MTAPDATSEESRSRRVDPVPLVAGLVFIAVALAAFVDRYWADLDVVLLLGGAYAALGVALMVSVALRQRRRGRRDAGLGG